MFLIGLTGGIAAGKSTIARRLKDLGAIVLSADEIARDAVAAGTPALNAIHEHFGDAVLHEDGTLNRAALGELVFGDSQRLADLNAIVHPAVSKLTRLLLAEIQERQPNAIVVYDVPLLIEANVNYGWDLVVVALADADIRRDRLIRERAMNPTEADRRIAAQATDAQRRSAADIIIDTGKSLDDTIQQTDELWAEIQRRSREKSGF